MIKQYQGTYDIFNQIFMVHREEKEKSNMELKMHESILHWYNPTDRAEVLINTIYKEKNKDSPRDKLTLQSKQNVLPQTWVSVS